MTAGRSARWFWILIFAAAGALLGYGKTQSPPTFEARATVRVEAAQALAALPEILEWEQDSLSVYAIPGTYLLEAASRDADAPAAARTLDAALAHLPAALSYLGLPPDCRILTTETRVSEKMPSPGGLASGALLGSLLGLILLSPQPGSCAPLSLASLLRKMHRRFRRQWALWLAPVILLAAGNWLISRQAQPVYQSDALVRVGEFDPEAVALRTAVLQGLYQSGLSPEPISVSPLGKSNLFRLRAEANTPEDARRSLQAAIDNWPQLEAHSLLPLPMTLLEPPTLPDTPAVSPDLPLSLVKGACLGLLLSLGMLFLFAVEEEKSFCD